MSWNKNHKCNKNKERNPRIRIHNMKSWLIKETKKKNRIEKNCEIKRKLLEEIKKLPRKIRNSLI